MSKRVAFLGGDTESFFEQFFVDDERGQIIPVPVEQADYVFYSNFVTDHHAWSRCDQDHDYGRKYMSRL